MLTLERLRNPSDEDLAGFDLAEVDLACAVGLPGSERLDIPACLAWLDHAAVWVRSQTEVALGRFLQSPATYDHSEGIFRIVAMMDVLWKGMGVHYNPERIDDLKEVTDSRDDFIHGIIEGRGGTCASLPVLIVAVGRRLGYPLKIVTTACHEFCRWEGPSGERFNIEITNTGLNTHPDEHYLTWPVDIRSMNWREETHFLRSLSPREEVALAWSKRGYCLRANGRLGEAVDSFATACSIEADDCLLDRCLWELLAKWREKINGEIAAITPEVSISFPAGRRYPGLPVEMERDIMTLEVLGRLLSDPIPTDADRVECRVIL